MPRVKITKKDLKKDELRTLGTKVYEYARKHQNSLIAVLAALVVILLGLKLYSYQKQSAAREANMLFTQASNNFQAGIFSAEFDKRTDKLQMCIENCKRIINDYASSPLTLNALYLQASAAFFKANTASDYDEAISLFNKYIDRARTPLEKAMGDVGLGYSYENKYFLSENLQLLPQAMWAYQQAIELGKDSAIAAEATLCKARLLELQRKDDEAAELYKTVKEWRKMRPLIASLPKTEFIDPQLNYLYNQLKTMQGLFSFSQTAEFALERLKGQK